MTEGSHSLDPPTPKSPIPLDSPSRSHSKHLLPSALSSTYPHGHISGHPREGDQLEAFNARKDEILATMSVDEIKKKYEEVALKAVEVYQDSERKRKEVDEAIESKKMARDMERRVHARWGRREI